MFANTVLRRAAECKFEAQPRPSLISLLQEQTAVALPPSAIAMAAANVLPNNAATCIPKYAIDGAGS